MFERSSKEHDLEEYFKHLSHNFCCCWAVHINICILLEHKQRKKKKEKN